MSVGRIAVLVIVLTGVAAGIGWSRRPPPLPWHDVGSARISTPAFDVAVPETRWALQQLVKVRMPEPKRGSFFDHCRADGPDGAETYLLSRTWIAFHLFDETTTWLALGNEGEVVVEGNVHGKSRDLRRRLTEAEVDALRTLIVDAGYARMRSRDGGPNPEPPRPGDPDIVSLQSCIQGRYFGVVRGGFVEGESEALLDLSARIEAITSGRVESGVDGVTATE